MATEAKDPRRKTFSRGAGALGFLCGAFELACAGQASDPNDDQQTSSGGNSNEVTGGGGGASGGSAPTGGSPGGGGASTGGEGSGGDTEIPDETHSVGCEIGTTLTEGTHTFELEDKERTFRVRLPENYDPSLPWPLVLALHPNGSGGDYWDSDTPPRNAREVLKDKAVLIIADAIGGNWRDYDVPDSTWPARLEEELLYFDHVVSEAKERLCLDEGAIFSMGFSGGGSFSGVLGCRRGDIRAIAAGGSVIYFDPQDCVQAPSALIALSEGDATAQRLEFVDHFRSSAGCGESNNETEPSGCVAYEGCAPGSQVHYCSHPGGHELPPYFTTAAWEFFDSAR